MEHDAKPQGDIELAEGALAQVPWEEISLAYAMIAQAKAAERQAAALERIAAVLEKVTNNDMLSVATWEQV